MEATSHQATLTEPKRSKKVHFAEHLIHGGQNAVAKSSEKKTRTLSALLRPHRKPPAVLLQTIDKNLDKDRNGAELPSLPFSPTFPSGQRYVTQESEFDSDDDDFVIARISPTNHNKKNTKQHGEVFQQLLKDGYRLEDLSDEDEDDAFGISFQPRNTGCFGRFSTCGYNFACIIS
eukprot:TRINITY_DN9118_c0_g3_i3.p1 TRINITY_DN9118_c0_g3~~TRINITY_DN9118_c0_g3_i3.p1  ORF type:complete len:176 (-),score=44.15 TRINITY_DN9118_c0_g3_i3:53-580(-)